MVIRCDDSSLSLSAKTLPEVILLLLFSQFSLLLWLLVTRPSAAISWLHLKGRPSPSLSLSLSLRGSVSEVELDAALSRRISHYTHSRSSE